MNCARCEEQIDEGQVFCNCCGAANEAAVGALSPAGVSQPSGGSGRLWGFLVGNRGSEDSRHWALAASEVEVGREGAGSDGRVELPHATVSYSHALLRYGGQPPRVVLTDKSSRNGSYVNGERLLPEQPRTLQDGDRVRFGLYDSVIKIVE